MSTTERSGWDERFDEKFPKPLLSNFAAKKFIRETLTQDRAALIERIEVILKKHRQKAEALTEFTSVFSTAGAMGLCDDIGEEIREILTSQNHEDINLTTT